MRVCRPPLSHADWPLIQAGPLPSPAQDAFAPRVWGQGSPAHAQRVEVEGERVGRTSKKKTSAIATDQRHMGGGPLTLEPLTEIKMLVGDSNRATTGVGADLPTQDDLEDSDQSSAERLDDRPTASTSGVTQPSPNFTPARDDEEEEEEEEQLILEPLEMELEVEMRRI